eukprot:480420-Pyramimonas_sp.AAC.1
MRYAYGLQQNPYCSLCQHEGRDNIEDVQVSNLEGRPALLNAAVELLTILSKSLQIFAIFSDF